METSSSASVVTWLAVSPSGHVTLYINPVANSTDAAAWTARVSSATVKRAPPPPFVPDLHHHLPPPSSAHSHSPSAGALPPPPHRVLPPPPRHSLPLHMDMWSASSSVSSVSSSSSSFSSLQNAEQMSPTSLRALSQRLSQHMRTASLSSTITTFPGTRTAPPHRLSPFPLASSGVSRLIPSASASAIATTTTTTASSRTDSVIDGWALFNECALKPFIQGLAFGLGSFGARFLFFYLITQYTTYYELPAAFTSPPLPDRFPAVDSSDATSSSSSSSSPPSTISSSTTSPSSS